MIRVFMVTFLDLLMAAVLNVYKAVWDTPYFAERLSERISVYYLAFLGMIIVALTTISFKHFRTFNEGGFSKTYGAVMEGTKYKTEKPTKMILGFPLIFFGRRIAFVVNALFLGHFLYGQLIVQMFI